MKGELRFAAIEYGELSMLLGGTVSMPLLLASNLDYINPIQVCLFTKLIHFDT